MAPKMKKKEESRKDGKNKIERKKTMKIERNNDIKKEKREERNIKTK